MTKSDGTHEMEKDKDELWCTLEKITLLTKERKWREHRPQIPQKPPKPPIILTPYDGISSWNNILPQFEFVPELHGWDCPTKAIDLAAHFQRRAHAILGDLDPSKQNDFSALIVASDSNFWLRHQL